LTALKAREARHIMAGLIRFYISLSNTGRSACAAVVCASGGATALAAPASNIPNAMPSTGPLFFSH